MFFVVLAMVGGVVGIRRGKARGVAVCLLICIVPSAILAVLITTNPVLPRYALFIGPFYFLLIGNAVVSGAAQVRKEGEAAGSSFARLGRAAAVPLCLLVVLTFCSGAINYLSPEWHRQVSYRPDFRGVVRHLESQVKPGDMIVLADDPGIGINVISFYWRGPDQVPALDARDPLLAQQKPEGDIYWVVSSLEPRILDTRVQGDNHFSVVMNGILVLVVRESRPAEAPTLDVAAGLQALSPAISPLSSDERYVSTLQGSTAQASGDITVAANSYLKAGMFMPLADEYLRTADGYAAQGRPEAAWREALIAKSMQPGDPAVHKWLADHLIAQSRPVEAGIEYKIVEEIQRNVAAATQPQSR
jgi:hypothetical protein